MDGRFGSAILAMTLLLDGCNCCADPHATQLSHPGSSPRPLPTFTYWARISSLMSKSSQKLLGGEGLPRARAPSLEDPTSSGDRVSTGQRESVGAPASSVVVMIVPSLTESSHFQF